MSENNIEMSQTGSSEANQYQAGRDINVTQSKSKTRLGVLFEKLSEEFNSENQIDDIIDSLQSFTDNRDVIGLEQKLLDGGKEHLYESVSWFKQEYYKKLEKFQYYPSAQKIHSLVLAIVLDKFHAYVSPLIRSGENESVILESISKNVVNPVYELIETEGCQDVMGLTMSDVNGMVYYLTGQCHINWS